MSIELKKPTTYDEQLHILEERGCCVENRGFCISILETINYYRLTAYFLPFRESDGNYRRGTSFYEVYRIYEFDRKLRGILFSAIEEIEIYLRAKFAYYHAHKYGADGYLNPANFSGKHDPKKFKDNLQREITSNSKALFVRHHLSNYDGVFPLWAACELFTFGMLSYFYGDMKRSDQREIADKWFHTEPQNIISWLRCCTDLRNICAHYGRLYYRIFPAMPSGFDQIKDSAKRRLFGQIMALKGLYPNCDKWNNEVLISIMSIIEEYGKEISLLHMAFPENWCDQLKKMPNE